MTIDEAIIDIKDNIKPVVGGISLDIAIDIMYKYQKIQEIVGEQGMPEWSYQRYMEIASIIRGYEDEDDN